MRYTRSVLLFALFLPACDDQRPLEEPESEPLTYGSPCRTDAALGEAERCPSPLVCFAGRADWTRVHGYCTDPCKVDADCSGMGTWAYCEPEIGYVPISETTLELTGGCAYVCNGGAFGPCPHPGQVELFCTADLCIP